MIGGRFVGTRGGLCSGGAGQPSSQGRCSSPRLPFGIGPIEEVVVLWWGFGSFVFQRRGEVREDLQVKAERRIVTVSG